jgi:hypothetical protein
MLGLRVPEAVAVLVDAARGVVPRSVWLRRAVEVYLEFCAVEQALAGPGLGEAAARARRGSPEVVARLAAAAVLPLPPRCVHGVRGGPSRGPYCSGCRALVDAEGWPYRLP